MTKPSRVAPTRHFCYTYLIILLDIRFSYFIYGFLLYGYKDILLFYSIDNMTCHCCSDMIDKLNTEYESLYEENEQNKRDIVTMYEEMKYLRILTARYEFELEDRMIHETMSIAKVLDRHKDLFTSSSSS